MSSTRTAHAGDQIAIDSVHLGDQTRKGEILEVLTSGGVTHYRVRWDDGHESVFFPGSDAHVSHPGESRGHARG